MSTRYAVWIEIEELDEDGDPTERSDSINVDELTFASTAKFESEDEAVAFAHLLHAEGERLLTEPCLCGGHLSWTCEL